MTLITGEMEFSNNPDNPVRIAIRVNGQVVETELLASQEDAARLLRMILIELWEIDCRDKVARRTPYRA